MLRGIPRDSAQCYGVVQDKVGKKPAMLVTARGITGEIESVSLQVLPK